MMQSARERNDKEGLQNATRSKSTSTQTNMKANRLKNIRQ